MGFGGQRGNSSDSDLDAVRELPKFRALVEESNQKCIEAQPHIGHDRAVLVPDNVTRRTSIVDRPAWKERRQKLQSRVLGNRASTRLAGAFASITAGDLSRLVLLG